MPRLRAGAKGYGNRRDVFNIRRAKVALPIIQLILGTDWLDTDFMS
jgi:hypothetical protein